MAKDHYYFIKDPSIIKEGMRVKCALDVSDIHMVLDEGKPVWFEGIIDEIISDYLDNDCHGLGIRMFRDDGQPSEGDTWLIVLTEDNMEYFKLFIQEWDD